MGIKTGFIGVGNMGASLLRSFIRSGGISSDNIYIYDTDTGKKNTLAKEIGVNAANTNIELVSKCDYILLAVKPGQVGRVLEETKAAFTPDKVLISVAAGINVSAMRSILDNSPKIVRTMPNLPVMVGEGMTVICFDTNMSDKEKRIVRQLFESSGKVEELEERLMNEVIALTGSSPAYVFIMIEAMADGAVQQGIPRDLAYRLAAQSIFGSAKMLLVTGLHPAELKDRVCSPAGTTIEAITALEKNKFRYSIIEAVRNCTIKAQEISRAPEKI